MIEHTAVLEAQGRIRLPNKDQKTGKWYVKYMEGDKWKEETFQASDEAWSFYYRVYNEIKNDILTRLRRERTK
jgi:hypothetical protein